MWRGLCYGIFYVIETMAYILAIHKSGGFKTKVMGFNVKVISVKPHYILVGFDLHGGGGQVGLLNASWVS